MTRIILVSDAAVHSNGMGTCAWTIWPNAEVRSREGYVPGLVTDMYSGLAEAYGIYTVLSFFYHYIQLHPLIFPVHCTIHVYCDNSGVIQKLQRDYSHQYPHDAIQDDYPIYAEIHNQMRECPKITVSFHHVKGHQHKMANQKLTLPEKLNIDCNVQAAALNPLPSNSPYCCNPLPQARFPHLLIKDQCIIQWLQHQLHDAATQQPYFDYLTSKFQWMQTAESTIYWPAIQLALRRFKATEQ